MVTVSEAAAAVAKYAADTTAISQCFIKPLSHSPGPQAGTDGQADEHPFYNTRRPGVDRGPGKWRDYGASLCKGDAQG